MLIPILLTVAPKVTWPDWIFKILWPGLALIMTIIILPCADGVFIAIIWHINVKANN